MHTKENFRGQIWRTVRVCQTAEETHPILGQKVLSNIDKYFEERRQETNAANFQKNIEKLFF